MPTIATLSPALLHKDPWLKGAWQCDIARFGRAVRGELAPGPKQLLVDPTIEQIKEITDGAPWLALDIECGPDGGADRSHTALDPTRARLRTVGMGTDVRAFSVRWDTAPGPIKHLLRELCRTRIIVTQNGPWYDHRVLRKYGYVFLNWEDTKQARRAISSTSKLSLAFMGSIYGDLPPWKEQEKDGDGSGKIVFTDDWAKLQTYNAMDCIVTAIVWNGITNEEEWKTPRVQGLYALHKDLATISSQMHSAGFRVDPDRRQRMAGCLRYLSERKSRKLRILVSDEFKANPNSIRRLVFKRYAKEGELNFGLEDPLDPKLWTPKGQIKVDFDALLQVYIDPDTPTRLKEIIKAYWEVEEYKKYRSTFVASKYVTEAIGDDDYLRPSWNSEGTDTGRFSCSRPNIMNIKKFLRQMYRASPGHILVHADFSQLELRVMAAVAEDSDLEQMLATGDVYSAVARQWFNLPDGYDVKRDNPAARHSCKIICLAAQYAAGTPTVYRQAVGSDHTFTWNKVRLLHQKFIRTRPLLVQYWGDEHTNVLTCGYSESRILERRRYYPAEPPPTETANYPIQSTASDVANLAMVRVAERLRKLCPRSRLINQLHDAFDVDAHLKEQRDVAAILKEEMEQPVIIGARSWSFPVEVDFAEYWHKV